jgi:hypothetical protein
MPARHRRARLRHRRAIADPLVRVKADGDLFLFKRKQIEQWRNTGNADFPFEPIGSPIKHGLLSEQAVTPFRQHAVVRR